MKLNWCLSVAVLKRVWFCFISVNVSYENFRKLTIYSCIKCINSGMDVGRKNRLQHKHLLNWHFNLVDYFWRWYHNYVWDTDSTRQLCTNLMLHIWWVFTFYVIKFTGVYLQRGLLQTVKLTVKTLSINNKWSYSFT